MLIPWLVLLLLHWDGTTSMASCPIAHECSCNGTELQCDFRSLSNVPVFVPNFTHPINTIRLNVNNIRTIPDNTFLSFQNMNVSYLDLSYNKISSISLNALLGVENISTLFLNDNNLTALPQALATLGHLQSLNLNDNPLLSLDRHVMAALGNTLLTLHVDVHKLSQWPLELRFLRHLVKLYISHLQISHLDAEMFHGLQSHLQVLDMSNTILQVISSAICNLGRLKELGVSYSPELNTTKHIVFEPCYGKLLKLSLLELNNNHNMSDFPVLTRTFSSIEILRYTYNDLEIMNSDDLSTGLSVVTCDLNNNKLTRIPYALCKFKILTTLNLSYNFITSIEEPDLAQLTSLQKLSLNDNPLKYISNNAFLESQLTSINLSNTLLKKLPSTITAMLALQTIYLDHTMIECTCDIVNLKGWNISNVRFLLSPKCYLSNEPLSHFIENDLNYC